MKEAMLYRKGERNRTDCFLCAQHCRIEPGQRGKCGVRENRDGVLVSLVYERLIAQNVDPIEKKPLFHFHPGSRSLSAATVGCNFSCAFCQNADISQAPRGDIAVPSRKIPAKMLVERALDNRCASISYTYTEPTVFMEYAVEAAELAHAVGISNVFVTNGYMTGEALHAAAPFLDAANVDLKAFSDRFYVERCGGRLKPVLQTLEAMKRHGIWVEVTTLLIPGLNDSPDELKQLAGFLVSLGPETPWHVTRFHPDYRLLDRPATPLQTLRTAREIGLEAGLHFVYTGNVPGDDGENTYCHGCGKVLIERRGFSIRIGALKGGTCSGCGAAMPGVGLQ